MYYLSLFDLSVGDCGLNHVNKIKPVCTVRIMLQTRGGRGQRDCAIMFINVFLHKVAPKQHKCFETTPDYFKWRR